MIFFRPYQYFFRGLWTDNSAEVAKVCRAHFPVNGKDENA